MHMLIADQRCVGIAEQGNIGDRKRAQCFAMVAARQADELTLFRMPGVLPGVKRHLERDLDGAGAIRGEEGMTKGAAGFCRKAFG